MSSIEVRNKVMWASTTALLGAGLAYSIGGLAKDEAEKLRWPAISKHISVMYDRESGPYIEPPGYNEANNIKQEAFNIGHTLLGIGMLGELAVLTAFIVSQPKTVSKEVTPDESSSLEPSVEPVATPLRVVA